MKKNLYEVLGVPKDATPEQIKFAYRKRAMTTHPDRETGSVEAHQELEEAYMVLSDPEKRVYYDRTGRAAKDQITIAAEEQLGNLFEQVIAGVDVDRMDVMQVMRNTLEQHKRNAKGTIHSQDQQIKKLEKTLKRVISKAGENLFAEVCKRKIAVCQGLILQANQAHELFVRMLELLADYEYKIDAADIWGSASGPFASVNGQTFTMQATRTV